MIEELISLLKIMKEVLPILFMFYTVVIFGGIYEELKKLNKKEKGYEIS